MSAGGGLVAEASTLYTAPDTKPDFQILLYPLMTSDVHVTKDAPDALIIRSNLDSVIGGETSYDYYAELCHKKANVEIDVYPEGCHGWGFADPRLMTRRELRKAGDFEEQLPNTREEVYSTLERWLGVRPARVEGIADKIDGPDQVLMLYPNGQDAPDGLPGAEGPLESNGLTGPEVIEEWGMVTPGSGDNAKIELYFPEKPNGQLVIICPGGGYRNLNGLFCGTLAGNFFKSNGITCCILKYRMPNGHKMVPLQDVWNTMRYCRHMADEWGIKQVGVMGSSAGGHLAAVAATLYKDAVTRPDFSILLYPVTTFNTSITHGGTRLKYLGKDMTEEDIREFSAELHVTPDTPPTYFACSRHDRAVPCENFTVYQKALYNNNVPAEAHVYFEGTHGWAFGSPYYLNALTRNNQGIYCLDEKPGKVYGDDLHGCRQDFETSLLRWLGSLR